MEKGFILKEGTPRILEYKGKTAITGGAFNDLSLYTKGDELLFDGVKVAESSARLGLYLKNDDLYFGNAFVEDDDKQGYEHLWIPPTQKASKYNPYTYAEYIEMYDVLAAKYPDYMKKYVFDEKSYGGYDLVHYVLTPPNYTKTFYIQAGIHGNEMDAKQTMYKIVKILCEDYKVGGYWEWKELHDNVRFFIIPIVSPYGHAIAHMNIPFTKQDGTQTEINLNRNYDFNHQYVLPNAGVAGEYPFQVPEMKHVKHVIDKIGYENIDYFIDYHDGGDVYYHFWWKYQIDGVNVTMIKQLEQEAMAFEDKYYPQYKVDGKWKSNTNDYNSTGPSNLYGGKTIGVPSSTSEYIGGYWGYNFDAEQMTRSLRFRGNLLLWAYKLNKKGWTVNDETNADYFHFDYPVSMTRQGLRADTTAYTLTIDEIYDRWDALATKYPAYIQKSESLGQNATGTDIYYYTIGNGNKKVLFVGGELRWNAPHKETEMGMYIVAEYLCNNYIVNQSRFLQELKNDYTICVLPCIDISGGGHSQSGHAIGLNSHALDNYYKWEIVNDKCQSTSYGNSCNDIPIFKQFLEANTDALMIVSGGEDTSKYGYEQPKYSTDCFTQFVLPLNQQVPSALTDYCVHLEEDREEATPAPTIEHTNGCTFGDYAYDNYNIPTYYINLSMNVNHWNTVKDLCWDVEGTYFYLNWETGRRMANIVNVFLMA